jgi:hypothetical protein
MSNDPQVELGESLPRFVSHWIAAAFGYLLMVLLPLIAQWPRIPDASWPQWWSLLIFAGLTSLAAAVVNANLPVTSRELIKSVALGFALNATIVALPF